MTAVNKQSFSVTINAILLDKFIYFHPYKCTQKGDHKCVQHK